MTKAVFFDWFNTLAQYYPPREEAHANACGKVGIEVEKERLSPGILLADHYYIDENTRFPLRKRSLQEQMEVYAQMERIVLREAGVNISDQLALTVIQEVGKIFANRDFVLFDDALAALDLLKQRGLILGIISNIDHDLVPVCQELGLAVYLGVIVTSREVGSEKPQPPIFLAAVERADVEPSEAVYVGDHYGTDVVGAQEVGMKGVLLDRHDMFSHITGCLRIRTLTELVDCM
ncbi:MAG: HAD-IA family hydrolase [Dehalococcoidia bacterium]|nr:HAD-IA family hydrolase [Dehalococcoidia bacterium]